MIQIKEYDGSIINEISYTKFMNYVYELRNRPINGNHPKDKTAVDIMTWVFENHLEAEFNRIATKLYNKFGMIGAGLALQATYYCFYDLVEG